MKRTSMCLARYALVVLTALLLAGCAPASPRAGLFSVEYVPMQLIPGQSQPVTLTVTYIHPSDPKTPTAVSYTAEVTAPEGWTVETKQWQFDHRMKTTDSGIRDTRKLSVTVPANAVPGAYVAKLMLSPASGTAQSLDLRFQLVKAGR